MGFDERLRVLVLRIETSLAGSGRAVLLVEPDDNDDAIPIGKPTCVDC